jgi:PII-like signaling protein
LAENLPITIEIVDSRNKIDEFLTIIEQQVSCDLLATIQAVELHPVQGRAK